MVSCDNEAVVMMVNSTASKCKNCMVLLRLLVLRAMQYNFRVFVKYIRLELNQASDSLSRLGFDRFWKVMPKETKKCLEKLPEELWPPSKIWLN